MSSTSTDVSKSGLTSNYATTHTKFGTQDNPPERVIEKVYIDGYNKDLENCPIKEEDPEWNEFKCDLKFTNKEHLENHSECTNKEGEFTQELKVDKDVDKCLHKEEDLEWSEFRCSACLLEFINKEHLDSHYSECSNKEGEFIQELKEGKANLFCSSYHGENFQKESYEQHIKRCHVESSYSRLNNDNDIYITNTKRYPAEVDGKEKKYSCTVSNYSTHTKEHVVKHMRINNNEGSFKYSTCDYTDKESETLTNHFSSKHYDVKENYDSKVYAFSTPSEDAFGSPRQIYTDEKPFKCDRCDYVAAQGINLKIHIKSKHSNAEKEYKCKDCEYSTHKKMDLVRHVLTHTNEKPFKCDMCDYATAQKCYLKTHVLIKHSNADKEYKCKDCAYSSHIKVNLVRHIRTHTNEKQFKCDLCDYAATLKEVLKRHVLAKHPNMDNKEYKCKDCEYSTYIKMNLVGHMRTHTNEKPFKCDVCDYAVAWKRTLHDHILAKHSNADKKYKCGDCEYSTHIKSHLVTHTRTHTNEKPFKCDMCDYAATQKMNLKKHALVKHSNAEKMYKCGDCDYSTYTKGNLLRHLHTHTN